MAFRSRRVPGFSLGAALAAVALVAAACGGSSQSGGVQQGGVYRLGSASSIDSLNPFVAFQEDAYSTFEIHLSVPGAVQQQPAVRAGLRAQLVGERRRAGLDVPHPADAKWSDGKPLTAADAAWTYSTILKFQNGPTANSAGDVAHMISATAPNADHRGAHLQAAGGQRAVPAAAGADPARARLGPVRGRQRQGADHVHQPGPDRLRRPVHPGQVHAEADRAVQAQPDLLRPQAAHRRPRPAVLRHLRRRDHRAEGRPAGRHRGGAADLGGRR